AALPLTPSGKVDRHALPSPDRARPELSKTFAQPRTVLEKRLASIWAETLGVDQVGIYDDFFELGGHSLLVTRLFSRMRDILKVDLPLRCFFESPTIEGITKAIRIIRREGGSAHSVPTVVDLPSECVLDPTIYPVDSPSNVAEPASVFLTGATGFLGAFLLFELLRQTRADVHCLVRASSPEEGKKKIKSTLETYLLWSDALDERIIPVIGDLAEPRLGLSPEEFRRLAAKVDAIYHSGALVNFIYSYSVLKPSNVLATQEVLRLACQQRTKPVHYVGALDIFESVNYNGQVVKEDDQADPRGLPTGYAQSKWVSEQLVWIAHSRGVPVSIYRPELIIGHSQTGVCNVNDV